MPPADFRKRLGKDGRRGGEQIDRVPPLPPVFVILGLGAIIMMLVFWVEFRFEPPWWVHVLIWLPLTFAGAVGLLRVLKAWLIAQQYRHRSTALEE